MDTDRIRILIERIQQDAAEVSTLLSSSSELPVIKSGELLQNYLDKGGEYLIEPGAAFSAPGFLIRKPVILHGAHSKLTCSQYPVEIFTSGVILNDFEVTSPAPSAISTGINGLVQDVPEIVPSDIQLNGISVPSHRNKRAFEINSSKTSIRNPNIQDAWFGDESKGINVLNTTGDILISGGVISAGSIGILVGGDSLKLPGEIRNIKVDNLLIHRPLSWKTDGIKRTVKTGLELKRGHNAHLSSVHVENLWNDGQVGYAFTFTPTNGGSIVNVFVEDCSAKNVPGGFNITGFDKTGINQIQTEGIRIHRFEFYGDPIGLATSTVPFIQATAIKNLEVKDSVIYTNGNNLITYYGSRPLESFVFTGNKAICNKYGLNFFGGPNGSKFAEAVKHWEVKGNIFGNAVPAMKAAFPDNEYVDLTTFKTIIGIN